MSLRRGTIGRVLWLLLAVLLAAAVLPCASARADDTAAAVDDMVPAADDTSPAVDDTALTDSACELMDEPGEDDIREATGLNTAVPSTKSLSCASFVSNSSSAEYIDRMLARYIAVNSSLSNALSKGYPVVFFFEGGSNNLLRYGATRCGALCLVVRQDSASGSPYIAWYCQDCSTLPDYPLAYSYNNGKDGYGMATVLDGVYSFYSINHNGAYAGFNVRTASGSGYVPALYMKQDGSFDKLSATGINIHARSTTSLGTQTSPWSAGCLLVGSSVPFTDYNSFMQTVSLYPERLGETTYRGYSIAYFPSADVGSYSGMLVIDRQLRLSGMVSIYGGDATARAAVDFLTEYSQEVSDGPAAELSCTTYPSYLTVKTNTSTTLRTLPGTDGLYAASESAGTVSSGTTMTVTECSVNSLGEAWYLVEYKGAAAYLRGTDTTVTAFLYDDVGISGSNAPTTLTVGKSHTLSGTIYAHYNLLREVSAALVDASGDAVYSKSVTCSARSYSLAGSAIDYALSFGRLPVGSYSYRVQAMVYNYYVDYTGQLTFQKKYLLIEDDAFTVGAALYLNPGQGSVTNGATCVLTGADGRAASLPECECEDRYFTGWYTAASGGTRVTTDTVFTASATLYAQWSMTPPGFVPAPEGSPFRDVYPTDYYYSSISWAADCGIAAGVGEELFRPDKTCTRAQTVTFLWRLFGSPEPTGAGNVYTDLAADWYRDAVLWATEKGITTGTGAGLFSPDDPCTRAQAVTMLCRAFSGASTTAIPFTDVASDSYYCTAVRWAVQYGITAGTTETTFSPDAPCTRGQLMTLLWRAAGALML